MRALALCVFTVVLASVAMAAKQPQATVFWPSETDQVLKFSVGKASKIGGFGGRNTYETDVVVESLYDKPISRATFAVFFFDKSGVRIGDGYVALESLKKGAIVKVPINFESTGTPASISVEARDLPNELASKAPPKEFTTTVYSVPPGAKVKVDGKEAGTTPAMVTMTTGKHIITFEKEGYSTGTVPYIVSPDQLPGTTITYELGATNHDTIVLRDGSTLSGDVESIQGMDVFVRVGGNVQKIDRNQISRILLVQRQPEQ